MSGGFAHIPVMLAECLEALAIDPQGVYLDGTAGGGGHSAAIAERLRGGRLYALDQDPDAIKAAGERLVGLPATLIQSNFRDAPAVLAAEGVTALDGALLDLGVSSHQLDRGERGFSYRSAGAGAPLDMRMSQSGPTAADLVAGASREELTRILREYGEEPNAWQIAGRIVREREEAPIETTGRLADIITRSLPPAVRRKDKNPSRRSFQALRIATNGELDALEEGLAGIFGLLKPGGRLAVITFHSLEDRIVKRYFKALATACTCPPEFPVCVCGGVAKGKLVGKNPLLPEAEELEQNRRSRSAKLRVVEKLPDSTS